MKKLKIVYTMLVFILCVASIGVGVYSISVISANIIGEVSIIPKAESAVEIEKYPTLEFYLIDSETNSVAVQQNPSNMPSGVLDIPSLIICDGIVYTVTTIACNTGGTKLVPTTTTLVEETISPQESILEDDLYGAFADCTDITELIIPNSVTQMDAMSFCYCTSLQKVVIGNGITTIEYDTFCGCSALYDLTLGNSVETIQEYAFCEAPLKELILPDSVTTIYQWAFEGSNGMEKLHIGKGLKNFFREDPESGDYCSADAICLIEVLWGYNDYVSHNNLQFISVDKNNTIFNDANGSNVIIETSTNTLILGCNKSTIPSTIVNIGQSAFYGCGELIDVTLPSGVTKIRAYTFAGCVNLETINLPVGIQIIDSNAFFNCHNLTDISFPDGLEYIGQEAFRNCTSLTSVILPESLTRLGRNIFRDSGVVYNTYDNAYYLGSVNNSYFALIKPTSSNITSCTTNENCKLMAENAFSNSNIQTITIPGGISNISEDAFHYCKSLTTVTIGNSVKSISNDAFYGCSSLTTVTIGTGIESIGNYAFSKCSKLTDFYCNATTPPTIEKYTFSECKFTLHVPAGCLSAYKNSTWGDYFVE